MNNISQLFDNADHAGFMQTNQESLELLSKAMEAGSGVDAAAFTGGRALTLESLDNTLVNILHTQEEAKLFQVLKKQSIKSVVHQWNERNEVGADDGAWVAEGGDSEEADQTIARKYLTVKYLQTKRVVTLQSAVSNMIEDAMALEKNAGTLWLIRNVERALFYGDSVLNTYQPDGLKKLIPSTHVIDLRGGNATTSIFEDKMIEACRIIRDYYGKADMMYTSTMIMEDIQKLLRDRLRVPAGENQFGAAIFKNYPTSFGSPKLEDNVFIKEGTTPAVSSLTTKVPGQPTIGSITSPTDAASEFATGDAGNYYYAVVPFNQYGDGTASATTSAVAVVAGDKVVLPVTVGAGATPTGYKVYRSKLGGPNTDLRYAFSVAYTASPMDVEDYNSDLPGCSDAFILTTSPLYNAIEWAQFLPMMKFDLYPTASAVYPFLMLLFGALALKKPVQHIRIKNIAPSSLGWF